MKRIVGVIILLLSLAFIAIVILRIWAIRIISLQDIIRSSATLVSIGVAIVMLVIVYGGFLKGKESGYQKNIGNRAHPKKT
ncbi:MAG: hypothetical protein ACXVJD_06405 [Mucilaginibacter sp.]